MSEIEDKLARMQAEVDQAFDDVERSTQDGEAHRRNERQKAKKDLADELESMGDEIKKKAVVKAAGGALAKLDGKKAVVGAVALLLLVLFVLKNIWFILFGVAGLGALWYVLSEWGGEEGDEDEEAGED